jgi:hypothetical protein
MVATVVPEIPVIHSLVTENFASATRRRSAWSSSDRGGRPSLSRGETLRQEGTEEPISAGRQWKGPSGSFRGQPGRGRRKRELPLARRGFPRFGTSSEGSKHREQSGTQERFPQEGPQNIERLWPGTVVPGCRSQGRGSGDQVPTDRPGGERPANLRAAQSSSSQGSSSEGAVRWKATPELVSQDREAGSQTVYGAGPR